MRGEREGEGSRGLPRCVLRAEEGIETRAMRTRSSSMFRSEGVSWCLVGDDDEGE